MAFEVKVTAAKRSVCWVKISGLHHTYISTEVSGEGISSPKEALSALSADFHSDMSAMFLSLFCTLPVLF